MTWADAAIVLGLVWATRVDLCERRIPDACNATILASAILGSGHQSFENLYVCILGAAAGLALTISAAWISSLRTRTPALGGGDVKLIAALGAWLGPTGIPWLVLISATFGLFAFAGYRVAVGPAGFRMAIPFAPCIAAAAIVVRWVDLSSFVAAALAFRMP